MGGCVSSSASTGGQSSKGYNGSLRNTNEYQGSSKTSKTSSRPNDNAKAKKKPQFSVSRIEITNDLPTTSTPTKDRPSLLYPEDPTFHCSVNGRNEWTVDEVYDLGKSCGKGTFGDVFIASHKHKEGRSSSRRTKVAIKKTAPTVLDRRGGVRIWTYDQVEDKCQEVKSLIRLKQENPTTSCVLYLYEYYWRYNPSSGQGTLHLVTELLGQELEEWRHNQTVLLESSVKKIAKVLLNALDFISSRNVIHRDIKLQNILFRVNGDFKTLKLVDFGLARIINGNERASDFCGSLGYIAPEIYEQRPYRYEVDMFAFGVILFRLLSGIRPFSSTNPEKLRSDTVNLRYKIEGKNWEGVSPNALKLVRKLLIGQQQRFTALEAASHAWFEENRVEDSVLVPDFSMLNDAPRNDDEYSRVIAFSQAPEELLPQKDGNKFFLDASVERAIRRLIGEGRYIGKIVTENDSKNEGLICVEEVLPPTTQGLPNYIVQLPVYTEKHCRVIFRDIVSIVKLCHDNGMAHRNLLLTSLLVDRKGKILVRGLQYAQAVVVDQPLTGHFGYLYSWYAFKAPEIDSEFFHDKTVDNWSLGAALYMLLTSLPPFRGDGVDLITNKHCGNVVFDTVVSSEASQRLVRALLAPDPRKRLSIEQILNSEWMIEADSVLESYDLSLAQALLQDFYS